MSSNNKTKDLVVFHDDDDDDDDERKGNDNPQEPTLNLLYISSGQPIEAQF